MHSNLNSNFIVKCTSSQVHKFCWSGEKKEKRGGLEIMLREDLAKDVVEVQRMSSRV